MMGKYRKAIFNVVYNLDKKEPEYLLLKRKLHWKGWEFCKGKIEPGEDKLKTAKRELGEETGLKIKNIRKFPYSGKYLYKKLLPDRPGKIGQTFTLFASEVGRGKISLDPKEHNGHKWVNFKQAIKLLRWPNQRKSLRMVNAYLMKRK